MSPWRWLLVWGVLLGGLVACATRPVGSGAGVGTELDREFNLPPASENIAVLALLEQAHTEAGGERPAGAAATLERALRIEPRNPRLWLELAQYHLAQGDSLQAEQMARRADAFAGSNRELRAAIWQVIARARSARGDEDGAHKAQDKVREFRR